MNHLLKSFIEEASSNEEIKQHLSGHKTMESFCREVVEQGRKRGYDFSEEEVRQIIATKDDRELQDEELDMAGGDAASLITPASTFGALGDYICATAKMTT